MNAIVLVSSISTVAAVACYWLYLRFVRRAFDRFDDPAGVVALAAVVRPISTHRLDAILSRSLEPAPRAPAGTDPHNPSAAPEQE